MIFAIVGPSGAGKDSLIAGAMRARPELRLVRRVITRPTDAGGEDFDGITACEFARRKALGDFALDWQAHGLSYAIPVDQVTGPGDILFNGSRAALPAAMQVFADLKIILVTAPDAVLAERLLARGREHPTDIHNRLARANFAMPDGIATRVVVNDDTMEVGIARLLAALQPVSA